MSASSLTPLNSAALVLTTALLLAFTSCSSQLSSDVAYESKKNDDFSAAEAPGFIQPLQIGGAAGDEASVAATKQSESKPLSFTNRKIIYTARVSLVVENFDGVEQKIKQLVEKYGGYIANADIGRMQGERRKGTWTLRVPVANFEAVLDSAGEIGVPVSRSQNSQDISEEYVDLQARIANKKKLEARLIQLLERPDDKIQHVIEVEKELARVREGIERMEGRLRYLSDRVELTTITLAVREEKEYTPPQAPTFSNRISKAWNSSLDNSRRFVEDSTVLMVANFVPLLIWLIILAIAFVWIRRHLKKRREEFNA